MIENIAGASTELEITPAHKKGMVTSMELNMTNENICTNETVFEGAVEQSVEFDYLLPDYCPNIFKILKCKIVPKLTSYRFGGNKLNIDLTAYIKIVYLAEETSKIKSLEQKIDFSKTVDLKAECGNPSLMHDIKTDYVNCRVVNQKRLDIRGAMTLNLCVTEQKCTETISSAIGLGVQLRKQTMTVGDTTYTATKQFAVSETLELSYGKPEFSECLYASAVAVPTEQKIIANKIIAKGDVILHLLYSPESEENNAAPEIMEHTMPISQIIDVAGISEDYDCVMTFDVCSVQISPSEDDSTSFNTDLIINVTANAYKNKETTIISDAYSTMYNLNSVCNNIKANRLISTLSEQCILKNLIEIDAENIEKVFDATSEIKTIFCNRENSNLVISGTLDIGILATNVDNTPMMIEKSVPFEHKTALSSLSEQMSFNIFPVIMSTAYSLSGDAKVELRTEMRLLGSILDTSTHCMINNIDVDTDSPKEKMNNSALTIYYPDKDENVWEVAKRYNTNVKSIMDENALENDSLDEHGIILIPIVE